MLNLLRPSHSRHIARWVSVVVAVLLSACTQLIDSDAARMCRSLLPILDAQAERVTIISTLLSSPVGSAEQAVVIDYRSTGALTTQRVSCLFAKSTADVRQDPMLGIAARLTSVNTESGAVGPLRLHLLKQNWIARGGASSADPAPYATAGPVPEAPRWFVSLVQNLASALPIISIYALLAAAYALVYGLVGRINLAFGELTMLAGYGAFLGYTIFDGPNALSAGIAGAIVIALYTSLTHGAAVGRYVLQPLVGRPGQHLLIASSGLALFWLEAVRLAQGPSHRWISPIFNRPFALVRDGSYVATITSMALVLPIIAGLAGLALLALMQHTSFGRRWRAFADDPQAATLIGIDPRRLILITMLTASAAATLAGLLTLLYYGGVGFSGGQMTGLKALIAAIIGGIGSVQGALLGGIVLGLTETIWSALFTIETRDPAVFMLLCVLLALRPDGLLGVKSPR